MSLTTQWLRVARGLQKVLEASARQTGSEASVIVGRLSDHTIDLIARASTSISAQTTKTNQQERKDNKEVSSDALHDTSRPIEEEVIPTTTESVSSIGIQDPTKDVELGSAMPSQTSSAPLIQGEASVRGSSTSIESDRVGEAVLSISSGPSESSESTQKSALGSLPDKVTPSDSLLKPEVDRSDSLLKPGAAVPATRVARALGFANLGIGLAVGTAVEGASRLFGSPNSESVVVNSANSDRLVRTLCRMRGAALKMGQMLSIQDQTMLPEPLHQALSSVRQNAEAMPKFQLESQLQSQLGQEWERLFDSFEEKPFAAASIGQVHRATLPGNKKVVVKVQYPGVAQSISSDLQNLAMLIQWTGMAPKGLFLDNIIRVGRQELQVECDYTREAENQDRMRRFVEVDPFLRENAVIVPQVHPSLATNQVLVSDFVAGGTIDKIVNSVPQNERDRIGQLIMYLTMRELFVWRFMQTDPNWGNFLYDTNTRQVGLIDFGAAREYSQEFVDGYLRIVWANANRDRDTMLEQSYRMGFLTGDELPEMVEAHVQSGFTVGEPFFDSSAPFDFRGSQISRRLQQHTSVFLRHRLTPPPDEVYTLHRKLAGTFMLCIELGAAVPARNLLVSILENHSFQDGLAHPLST